MQGSEVFFHGSLAELKALGETPGGEGGFGGEVLEKGAIDLRTDLRTVLRLQSLVNRLELEGHEGFQLPLLVGLAKRVIVALLT